MVPGDPITVQVMHLGTTPLRLTTDMTLGYISPYVEPTYEVSLNELEELFGTTRKENESPPLVVRIPFSGPNGIRIRCVPPSPDEDTYHVSISGLDYNLTMPDY